MGTARLHSPKSRAGGLIHDRGGLEAFRWSSLGAYIGWPGKRPHGLETAMGFSVAGCKDSASGRREFLSLLEKRVDWRRPSRAGLSFPPGEREADLAIHSALRRGWLFGSQVFRERMLRVLAGKLGAGGNRREDGYRGAEVRDHGLQRAHAIIEVGCKTLTVTLEELQRAAKSDWRKTLLAELVQSQPS